VAVFLPPTADADPATASRSQSAVGAHRGHRLATKRIINLHDTAAEPWIDIRCEAGCCRAATSAAFQQAGFIPHRW
jgi:hypothetical protein